MESYQRLVRGNKGVVQTLETVANGLVMVSYAVAKTELQPEVVSVSVGVLRAINGHILQDQPIQTHERSLKPSSSFPWALFISAVKEVETLVEVAACEYYGVDNKWDYIAITEAAKVLFRLALFSNSGYKMILDGAEPLDPEKDLIKSDLAKKDGEQEPPQPSKYYIVRAAKNLEEKVSSGLCRLGENVMRVSTPSWVTRLQQQRALALEAQSLVVTQPIFATVSSERGLLRKLFVMAEVFHITRPLIYVLLVRKYGVRSWMPWLLSLGTDLTGLSFLYLVKSSVQSRKYDKFSLSTPEKNEVKRRKMLLAFYLMRDPFFTTYTRERLEMTGKLVEHVPRVGFVTGKLIEMIIGVQSRYTYIAGS